MEATAPLDAPLRPARTADAKGEVVKTTKEKLQHAIAIGNAAMDEVEKLRLQLCKNAAEIQSFKEEIATLRAENDRLKRDNASLKDDLGDERKWANERAATVETLRRQLAVKEREIKACLKLEKQQQAMIKEGRKQIAEAITEEDLLEAWNAGWFADDSNTDSEWLLGWRERKAR
jgi:regulator of replication initiation timing